ncbi:MAG TPA: FAD:protein FMN transferase [Mogibacterium sp.]|nr:FAD:protein FMN transferase [Mogibacterium sp.]
MKKTKYTLILALITTILIITQTGCKREGWSVTETNYMLDTMCTITIYEMKEGGEEEAKDAIDKAYDLCSKLEEKLSRTKEGSDISKLNKAGGWVKVSDDTLEVVKSGIRYSKISGGVFDITIGGLTELWDFHSENPILPDDKDLRNAVGHVSYKNITINGNKLRLKDPKTKIDLGGIAKGYIADRMVDLLEKEGVTSGIVNLGGNVVCIGGKPGDEDFNIGVEAPFSDGKELIGSLKVKDKTLVTSGVYERSFDLNGKNYHHILSTATGYPVETDLDAVTLVADKGHSMDIDALSTICLIKGAEKGMKFIEKMKGIEAIFILSDGTVKNTSGIELN